MRIFTLYQYKWQLDCLTIIFLPVFGHNQVSACCMKTAVHFDGASAWFKLTNNTRIVLRITEARNTNNKEANNKITLHFISLPQSYKAGNCKKSKKRTI